MLYDFVSWFVGHCGRDVAALSMRSDETKLLELVILSCVTFDDEPIYLDAAIPAFSRTRQVIHTPPARNPLLLEIKICTLKIITICVLRSGLSILE